ncbi:MAG: lysylphosphatidylglycerol synthase transmembrane domain-containing protein, partial [Chitinophagaceae bacterium]
LFLALIAFIFSKIIAAIRLNYYFRNIDIHLTEWQNFRLYWMGMFYNLFLPGSISGDAYKVILLKRKFNATYKKTTSAVLLDRFSGLLGLGLFLGVYSIIVLKNTLFVMIICAGALLAVLAFYLIVRFWLKDFIPSFMSTLLLGIIVQGLQIICTYLIMASLGIPFDIASYIFIFLFSSIAAVLPFTIGGLGAREIVFLEGSGYFGLPQETSIVISLLFYLITLLTSAFGSIYVFSDPLKNEKRLPDKDSLS